MNISDTTVVFGREVQEGTVLVIDCPGRHSCTVENGLPHYDGKTPGFHLYTVVRRHVSATTAICTDENGGEQGWTSTGWSPVRILRPELAAQAAAFAALMDPTEAEDPARP